jgi:hypothetical protein
VPLGCSKPAEQGKQRLVHSGHKKEPPAHMFFFFADECFFFFPPSPLGKRMAKYTRTVSPVVRNGGYADHDFGAALVSGSCAMSLFLTGASPS